MKTDILLVGIGGYGDNYVRALTNDPQREDINIVGVVDPFREKAKGYETLKSMDVPFFDTMEEFYKAHTADLAIISTPIPLHESQSILAFINGSHVLLEKPIAATPEAGRRIFEASIKYDKKLAIGFQWCYDKVMLKLKSDFEKGLFGRPLHLKALVLWPRNRAYYSRGTGWAGKKYSNSGDAIFDSIASNATAHYLENMLWLTDSGLKDARFETWKANDIETYDTVTLLGALENGAKITYIVSHAVHPDDLQDPMFEYRFENATAYFGGFGIKGTDITVKFNDGTIKNYGVSYNNGENTAKLWHMIDAVREDRMIPCTAQDALLHTDAISYMRIIQPDAFTFDNTEIINDQVVVPDLGRRLKECYREDNLLSETDM